MMHIITRRSRFDRWQLGGQRGAMETCTLPGCTRPVHRDAATGIAHDYCGRTHAREALEAQGAALADPHGKCHTCKLPGCGEPVYYDRATGRVHDFCCRSHAVEAVSRGIVPPSNRPLQGRSSADNRCSLPGCSAPRYRDPSSGFEHDFCGRTHAREASAQGLLPAGAAGPNVPSAGVDRVWRGRAGVAYALSVLTNAHPKYQGIKQQFLAAWQHPAPRGLPTVMRVLQIRNPADVYARYHAYRAWVGNEQRRFHGTSLAARCSFGIDVTQPPCTDPSCAVCTICASSFDLQHAGSARVGGFFRYGRGLYFSRVSSKSNDYNINSQRDNPKSLGAGSYRCESSKIL